MDLPEHTTCLSLCIRIRLIVAAHTKLTVLSFCAAHSRMCPYTQALVCAFGLVQQFNQSMYSISVVRMKKREHDLTPRLLCRNKTYGVLKTYTCIAIEQRRNRFLSENILFAVSYFENLFIILYIYSFQYN